MGVSGTAIVLVSILDPALPSVVTTFRWLTEPRPPLLIATLLLDLAVGQLVLATFATRNRRGVRSTGIVGASSLGLVLMGSLFTGLRETTAVYTGPGGESAVVVLSLVAAAGAAAVIAGASLAVHAPATHTRRRRLAITSMLTVPVVAYAASWILLRLTGVRLTGTNDRRFPDSLPLSTVLETRTEALVLIMAGLGMVATAWQATEGARAARDTGHAVARGVFRLIRPRGRPTDTRHAWQAVTVILSTKLLWVGAGLTGTAPWWLGGDFALWGAARDDGWLSWTVGIALAGLVVAWILRGCPGPGEDDAAWSVGLVLVGVLVLPEVVFQLMSTLVTMGGLDAVLGPARAVEVVQPWAPVVAGAGCAVAAVWRHRAGQRDSATLLLAAFGVWTGLRVPALVHDLIVFPWFPWGLSMPSESTYGQHQGWVNLATIDAVMTAMLTVVALLATLGRIRVRMLPVLLVSVLPFLLVYPADLVALLLRNPTWTSLVFVLPFLYLFLADAGALNKPGPHRGERLLGVVVVSLFGVMVAVLRGARGDPGSVDQQFTFALILVPVLVVSVVATLSRSSLPGRSPAGAGRMATRSG